MHLYIFKANDGVSNSKRVSEKLQQLLTEPTKFVSDVGFMYKNENYLSNQISQLIANLINEKKTEQEFTDQLWNILIGNFLFQFIFIMNNFVKNTNLQSFLMTSLTILLF